MKISVISLAQMKALGPYKVVLGYEKRTFPRNCFSAEVRLSRDMWSYLPEPVVNQTTTSHDYNREPRQLRLNKISSRQ